MQQVGECYVENNENWPRVVKRGGACVRIYRIKNRGRVAFQVAYYLGGRRILRNFARLADARAHAETQATLLNAGQLATARMCDADRQAYITAKRILEPTGIPLIEAAQLLVAAIKELNGEVSLIEAARHYGNARKVAVPEKSIDELVTEFLAAKRQDQASARYMKTLTGYLAASKAGKPRNSFADAFKTSIGAVTARDIDDWVRNRGVGPRTRRNILMTLRVFFNYAKARGYLHKDRQTEADLVPIPKTPITEVGILEPDQLRRLLVGTPDIRPTEEWRLWLAVGAFTGLRTEEMKRLEWRDVSLARHHIEVPARKAKTGSWRLVPIHPNLAQWLALYAKPDGKVFPHRRVDARVHEYARKLGIPWPSNALRHSYATYRFAVTYDLARTAAEMGNSPAIVERHYKELATPQAGSEWFGIMPLSVQSSIGGHLAAA